MKINDYINGTVKTFGEGKVEGQETGKAKGQAEPSSPQETGDKVQLSDRSREIARAREAVESAPEVRSEKVARIKSALQTGTYNVKAEKVAEAVIRGMIDETV